MNYSERETSKLIELYEENPCLDTVSKLANIFNKPKKSIISKLVKEGVYQKKGYVTKQGQKPITKLQLVRQIEEMLDTSLVDLDKAPKGTLMRLRDHLRELESLVKEARSELLDVKAYHKKSIDPSELYDQPTRTAKPTRTAQPAQPAQPAAERGEWDKYLK